MKYSNLTLGITVTGTGRGDTVVRAPLTPTTWSVYQPPGALNNNTPFALGPWPILVPGVNLVFAYGSPTPGNPIYYMVMVPPSNSANGKRLLGSPTDYGITIAPNLPMALAFANPTSPQSLWINSVGKEQVELWML